MKPIRKFEQFYKDVPSEQREALRRFRGQYLQEQVTIDGADWRYRRIGYAGDPLLWLVGGLRMADAAFQSIAEMGQTYDIIAPDYATLDTMAALADGLVGILDAVGMAKVAVLCGSLGGMLGQVLVRRHPQRVSKLILSTTVAPDYKLGAQYAQQLAGITALDDTTLAQVAQETMFRAIQPPAHEEALWRAYLAELYEERVTRADILSTYRVLIDYMNMEFFIDDLDDWRADGGELLLISSDDDATFGTTHQADLHRLYPWARVHRFEGAGHSPSSTQRETYFALVRDFLG